MRVSRLVSVCAISAAGIRECRYMAMSYVAECEGMFRLEKFRWISTQSRADDKTGCCTGRCALREAARQGG